MGYMPSYIFEVNEEPVRPSAGAANVITDRLRFDAAGDLAALEHCDLLADGNPLRLTRTEFRLLRKLFQKRGCPVTASILGIVAEISDSARTVARHMYNIREKIDDALGEGWGKALILERPGFGYTLRDLSEIAPPRVRAASPVIA